MPTKEEEFQQRLLATFRVEAEERLGVLSTALIQLEQAGAADAGAVLEGLVREAHSLKGAARAVNLAEVEGVARALERVLAGLKQAEIAPSATLFDVLHRAVDGLGAFLAVPDAERGTSDRELLRGLVHALEQAQQPSLQTPPISPPQPLAEAAPAPPLAAAPSPPSAEQAAAQPPPAAERPAAPETVRIPTARLGAVLLQAEQLLSAKFAAEHFVAELRGVTRGLADWQKELSRPAPARLPASEGSSRHVKLLEARLGTLEKAAEQNYRFLGSAVANLLEDMKGLLMLPFSLLLEIFPKMVRDLSRDQGKEVEAVIEGGDIEIDKRILDDMRDPLVHLVRNGIDHGIEVPDDREAKGKPRRGRLTLTVAQREAGKVEITIADDGAGMDPERLRAAAVKHGVLEAAEAERLGEQEVMALAFRSGVTTSPIVTDFSGRGLGLAIVQERVAKMNGTVAFDSQPGVGTTFSMVLPLALATFRGVVVSCAEQLFIIPTANVEQVLRLGHDDIRTVENRETIQLQRRVVALAQLADVLGLPASSAAGEADKVHAVVVGAGGRRVAFAVDRVLHEQDVLVKPLGKQLVRVRNVAGATVLGSGAVVPILNVADLLASAVKWAAGAAVRPAAAKAEKKTHSLLVVEDSITTRTLLRNILEAAGYEVRTAVDGVDAYAQLRGGKFDLVVSDVAMPGMDGFELTAAIRADKQLAGLPVVLVTALECPPDRERGIDVGASAYIVKSSFDQGNLLETIERLL